MPYAFSEHTADLRMHVTGQTLHELFRDALFGMTSVVRPDRLPTAPATERTVSLTASDITGLLIEFLNEALTLMHVHREGYTGVTFASLTDHQLRATLQGFPASVFAEDIKAVTYHEAQVVRDRGGSWSTTVIFDL